MKHEFGFHGYADPDSGELQPGADCEWLRTGDLARMRGDGALQLLGRCDHSINRDGRLVLFPDIEGAIGRIDSIERAAVVSEGRNVRGGRLVAFCVLGEGCLRTAAVLRSEFFDVLPPFMVPDEVVIVPSLPTLGSGKLDRRALAGADADRPESRPMHSKAP